MNKVQEPLIHCTLDERYFRIYGSSASSRCSINTSATGTPQGGPRKWGLPSGGLSQQHLTVQKSQMANNSCDNYALWPFGQIRHSSFLLLTRYFVF